MKSRLYEVARRAVALAALTAVAASGIGAGQVGQLPGRPDPAAVSDPLDAYLMGMWHLSLATGRSRCAAAQLTVELRSLTARDLSWTERGTQAATSCGGAGGSAYLHPFDLDAAGLPDLHARLDAVRADYRQLAEPSRCWSGRGGGNVAVVADVLYSVGRAAAAAACSIASWNRLQSPFEADAVRGYLHAARTASPSITDRSLRAVIDTRVNAALAQLDTQSGETLYHAILSVVEATRTELRRTR